MASTTETSPRATQSDVNTKQVTGRRTVHYDSFDDLLRDAEHLSTVNVQTLGNWSYGQILDHLARACNGMIDGIDFSLPAPMRLIMKLFMKKKMLTESLPPGFKIPKGASAARPQDVSVEAGLASLQKAVARVKSESSRVSHPAFGSMTREEWDEFQLRHCEMHMSFVQPTNI